MDRVVDPWALVGLRGSLAPVGSIPAPACVGFRRESRVGGCRKAASARLRRAATEKNAG